MDLARFQTSQLSSRLGASLLDSPSLITSEPRLPASIVIELDNDDGIFEIASEPTGPGSATTVIGIDNNDGVDATWSEPPGLGSILDESIANETWSESPGLGLIPSEPLLSSSIDNGIGTAPGEQHKKIRSFEIL